MTLFFRLFCFFIALFFRSVFLRWLRSSGGPALPVALFFRWLCSSGGPILPVALFFRKPRSSGGPVLPVALFFRRPWFSGDPDLLCFRWLYFFGGSVLPVALHVCIVLYVCTVRPRLGKSLGRLMARLINPGNRSGSEIRKSRCSTLTLYHRSSRNWWTCSKMEQANLVFLLRSSAPLRWEDGMGHAKKINRYVTVYGPDAPLHWGTAWRTVYHGEIVQASHSILVKKFFKLLTFSIFWTLRWWYLNVSVPVHWLLDVRLFARFWWSCC